MEKLKICLVVLVSFLLIFPQSVFTQKNLPLPEKNIPNWTCDLLIVGGTVVTMDKDRRLIEDGAVAVKDGKIALVGTRAVRAGRGRRTGPGDGRGRTARSGGPR